MTKPAPLAQDLLPAPVDCDVRPPNRAGLPVTGHADLRPTALTSAAIELLDQFGKKEFVSRNTGEADGPKSGISLWSGRRSRRVPRRESTRTLGRYEVHLDW